MLPLCNGWEEEKARMLKIAADYPEAEWQSAVV
jgi:hypothetical protein